MKPPILIMKTRADREQIMRAVYGAGFRWATYRTLESALGQILAGGYDVYDCVFDSGGICIAERKQMYRIERYALMNSAAQFVTYVKRYRRHKDDMMSDHDLADFADLMERTDTDNA